jgi:hypothetical protein
LWAWRGFPTLRRPRLPQLSGRAQPLRAGTASPGIGVATGLSRLRLGARSREPTGFIGADGEIEAKMGSTPSQSWVQESNLAIGPNRAGSLQPPGFNITEARAGVASGSSTVVCRSKRRIRGERSMFPCQYQANSYKKIQKTLDNLTEHPQYPSRASFCLPPKDVF